MTIKADLNNSLKRISLPTLTFFVGILMAIVVNQAMATFGDDGLIHVCLPNGNGSLRIVDATDTCNPNESELSWPRNYRPFTCYQCDERAFDNLSGKDLSDSYITSGSMNGVDLSNTNWTDSILAGVTMTNTDLSNANFKDASLEGSDLTGATGLDTGNTTGVTWQNTTCPDGTNSDSHSNTCVGHLTP